MNIMFLLRRICTPLICKHPLLTGEITRRIVKFSTITTTATTTTTTIGVLSRLGLATAAATDVTAPTEPPLVVDNVAPPEEPTSTQPSKQQKVEMDKSSTTESIKAPESDIPVEMKDMPPIEAVAEVDDNDDVEDMETDNDEKEEEEESEEEETMSGDEEDQNRFYEKQLAKYGYKFIGIIYLVAAFDFIYLADLTES